MFGVARWWITCSVQGWQDKHQGIAKTTVDGRGIDHAKVASTTQLNHGNRAMSPASEGPQENTQKGTRLISE